MVGQREAEDRARCQRDRPLARVTQVQHHRQHLADPSGRRRVEPPEERALRIGGRPLLVIEDEPVAEPECPGRLAGRRRRRVAGHDGPYGAGADDGFDAPPTGILTAPAEPRRRRTGGAAGLQRRRIRQTDGRPSAVAGGDRRPVLQLAAPVDEGRQAAPGPVVGEDEIDPDSLRDSMRPGGCQPYVLRLAGRGIRRRRARRTVRGRARQPQLPRHDVADRSVAGRSRHGCWVRRRSATRARRCRSAEQRATDGDGAHREDRRDHCCSTASHAALDAAQGQRVPLPTSRAARPTQLCDGVETRRRVSTRSHSWVGTQLSTDRHGPPCLLLRTA